MQPPPKRFIKFRIVGSINFLIGLGYLFNSIKFFISAFQQKTILSQTGAQSPLGVFPVSFVVFGLFMLLLSLLNIFLGVKLFSKNEQTTGKYLKWGLVTILFSTIGIGLLAVFAIRLFVLPVYNQTATFESLVSLLT